MRPPVPPQTRASASRARFSCKNVGGRRAFDIVGSCFDQDEGLRVAFVVLGTEEASLLQRGRGKRSTDFVVDSEFLVVLYWSFFRGGQGVVLR